jgi:polyketide synthase PksJ
MNHSRKDYDYSATTLFELQVHNTPDLIALQDKNIKYTYRSLNQKANQFAHYLKYKHITSGQSVAILLEPGADFIICVLAILKIGAIYVPIDTLAPKSRLKNILDDAKPKILITNTIFQNYLNTIESEICLIKHIHLESISYSKENLKSLIKPKSPIYMMYTSGSTGSPKGVIISHRAVVNLTKIDNYANVKKTEIVAQFSNLAFDASTFEIWSALLNGATLTIIPTEIRTNPTELRSFLKDNVIQYLFLPTGYFHQLIKSEPSTLDTIRVIVFGGEQINKTLLKNFIAYRKKNQFRTVLINGYGPTEATTFTCRHLMNENSILDDDQLMSIGTPIKNVTTYILDENKQQSTEGELYISGVNLANCYHNSLSQNNEKFIENPFNTQEPNDRLYKTGDKVRQLDSGELLCLGRLDDQVKIGGFRIHLNEIEQQLVKYPNISLAAVTVEIGGGSHKLLTAYLVLTSKEIIVTADQIRKFLSQSLPAYMIPTKYIMVDDLSLTLVGKVDKKNLDKIPHTDLSFHIDASSSSTIEETIKTIWRNLLNRPSIETNKNLFELGANSLLITESCSMINKELKSELQISDILAYPTIHKLSRYLEGDLDAQITRNTHQATSSDIAIIGMSCRLPKANTLQEYWDNLCSNKDCLTRFDEKEIENSLFQNENFVPVKGILSNIDQFDASFFGFSPADASITDPQQRVFLECALEALEHSGVAPNKLISKMISVFAGMTDSTYLHENLLKNYWVCNEYDNFQQRIATSIGMLSTQTSYRLNLKGRSINVNTGCSTGLIAVDQACQDLILGKSDIALAGAASIVVPQVNGYLYHQGSITSPDGYCRPFSNNANGTVFSNGVGVVILKRLEDAITDKDTIYAIIKGSGVNNDGLDKLGFTAPSVSGQMACIKEALSQANVFADEITLLETHGTATTLGDIIEINALTSAYREQTDKKQFCALGSVKANIGHTDVTAGIAGLIKATLCLYHKKIPPLTHFNAPNPNLSLNDSPFYVNTQLIDWESVSSKRYAGVSAFGVGGTNIHMILGNYENEKSTVPKAYQHNELILLSAKTEQALEQNTHNLTQYLVSQDISKNDLANIAYTLQTGREDYQWRRFGVGNNYSDIVNELIQKKPFFFNEEIHQSIVFMFPGQGMQYHEMAMELFDTIPKFAMYVEQGALLAKPYLKYDLLNIICNPHDKKLSKTQYAQPALFIIEYALAKLLIDCGIKPDSLIGHSLGEYVAACLSGVFSFEDGIALICERGLLMASAPKGKMLAIECSEEEFYLFTSIANIELALHNTTNHCVVSGEALEIDKLEQHLSKIKKSYQKLKVSHAFHSRLMEPLEQSFKEIFSNITLSAPSIPIISNVTGDWLSTSDATNPDYWYQHLRYTVKLCSGLNVLFSDAHPMFIEVGPGQSLSNFLKDISHGKAQIAHTLPNHLRRTSDLYQFLSALGKIWQSGVDVHWRTLYQTEKRHHIPLPTYAFQRQRYWVEPDYIKLPLSEVSPNFTSSLKCISQHTQNNNLNLKTARTHLNVISKYVSPSTPLESELAKIWQNTLGIENIGIEDDFFALGGHSLKAIKLIEKLNKVYKCNISIQHLYAAPTIYKLNKFISSNKNTPEINITVPLKIQNNTTQNLFLCHPASGMINCFDLFISECQTEFSVYGLQDPSIASGRLLYDSLNAMAEAYLSAIKKIQPTGPYYLMGYSFGGTLLFEIAHKLQKHNEKIALLSLIDSWPVFSEKQYQEEHVKQLLSTYNSHIPQNIIDLTWARVKLLLTYVPPKIKQEIILFKATKLLEEYQSIDHPVNHWSKFNNGKIVCYPIDANHETIMNSESIRHIIGFIQENNFLNSSNS